MDVDERSVDSRKHCINDYQHQNYEQTRRTVHYHCLLFCSPALFSSLSSGWKSRFLAGTPTAILSLGTSRVTTDPAAVRPRSSTVMGAMSIVSLPMKAWSPTTVLFFFKPSKFTVIVPAPIFT